MQQWAGSTCYISWAHGLAHGNASIAWQSGAGHALSYPRHLAGCGRLAPCYHTGGAFQHPRSPAARHVRGYLCRGSENCVRLPDSVTCGAGPPLDVLAVAGPAAGAPGVPRPLGLALSFSISIDSRSSTPSSSSCNLFAYIRMVAGGSEASAVLRPAPTGRSSVNWLAFISR